MASTLVRTWHDVVFIWGFVHPWTGLEVDGQLMMGDYFYSVCFCVLKVFFKKFNYYYYFFILN